MQGPWQCGCHGCLSTNRVFPKGAGTRPHKTLGSKRPKNQCMSAKKMMLNHSYFYLFLKTSEKTQKVLNWAPVLWKSWNGPCTVTHSVEFQTKIWLTNVKSMLGANLYAVLPYSLKITPYSKSTYKKNGDKKIFLNKDFSPKCLGI